jgi:predicted sulfurtransferase
MAIMYKIFKYFVYIGKPTYVCPQSKTKDKNCIFWTLYLAEQYINQFIEIGSLDIKAVLENLYQEYPEKEDLDFLIKEYKESLHNYYDSY